MSRLIDITLAPLYTTVGIGDMLTDRVARRRALEATQTQIDTVIGRGRGLTFDALTSLPVIGVAIGTRLAHDEQVDRAAAQGGEPEAPRQPFSLLAPLTNPLAALPSLVSLLRRDGAASRVPGYDPFDVRAKRAGSAAPAAGVADPLRYKRTAASRTSSPSPSPHRQPVAEQASGHPPLRMASSRTSRPSGMEAASTATRAARRAALRAEQQ